MRALFTICVLALPFLAYVLLAVRRRARYRALAARLGARHVDAGGLRPGCIVGEGFEIEAVAVGKTYRTRVQVAVGSGPGPFFVAREFFAAEPDWSAVRVLAPGKGRVFLWELAVERHVPPHPGQRDSLLAWLPPGALSADTQAAMAAAGIRDIVLGDGWATVRFRGILSNPARLERVLAALHRLAPEAGSPAVARAA